MLLGNFRKQKSKHLQNERAKNSPKKTKHVLLDQITLSFAMYTIVSVIKYIIRWKQRNIKCTPRLGLPFPLALLAHSTRVAKA